MLSAKTSSRFAASNKTCGAPRSTRTVAPGINCASLRASRTDGSTASFSEATSTQLEAQRGGALSRLSASLTDAAPVRNSAFSRCVSVSLGNAAARPSPSAAVQPGRPMIGVTTGASVS